MISACGFQYFFDVLNRSWIIESILQKPGDTLLIVTETHFLWCGLKVSEYLTKLHEAGKSWAHHLGILAFGISVSYRSIPVLSILYLSRRLQFFCTGVTFKI
jgi:hypothetical protein